MEHNYWHKQTADEPLFPDLLWSKPENKALAGKLLIIGGDAHGFGVPGEAFAAAQSAGIGVAKVILPSSVKPLVPEAMQSEIDFLLGVKNGSFAKSSLSELLEHATWADVVLLAGGIGRNSETTTLVERFVDEFAGKLVISGDVLDVFQDSKLLERQSTVVVASLGQLQKFWAHDSAPVITHSDSMMQFTDKLHKITKTHTAGIITVYNNYYAVAHSGQVSTTPASNEVWQINTAAKAATWWAQHPAQLFETITTSLVD